MHMNPLIPEVSDVLLAFAVTLNTILAIAALVALARDADNRRWVPEVLLIVFVPIVGSIVSLIATRRRRVASARSSESDTVLVS